MTSKERSKFRASGVWKKFRMDMYHKFQGTDPITGKTLHKGWSLHHLCMDYTDDNYTNLDPSRYIPLNRETHKMLHFLFTYYKKDTGILDRLKEYLDVMKFFN